MNELPRRKLNRLNGYNYSHGGFYMITTCTHNRINSFGEIINYQMIHNQYGLIVNQSWQWLSQQYPYIITDENIMMPNHFHGILYINREYTRTGRDLSLPTQQIKSLSEIIGSFKTRSSKLIHKAGLTEFQWQRSFYDTIIHNETQLENFRRYIRENPVRWWRDRNNI